MIEWLEHSSDAIKGFPMGDPHERKFPIYLPPGYDEKKKDGYPVVFLLAGWGGRSSKYVSGERASVCEDTPGWSTTSKVGNSKTTLTCNDFQKNYCDIVKENWTSNTA